MDNPEGETALKHRHGARPLRYWEAIRMSEPFPNFRNRLFDSGLILMAIECGIYPTRQPVHRDKSLGTEHSQHLNKEAAQCLLVA
jgi:hypothetical protein